MYPAEAASFYTVNIPFKADKVKDAVSYTFKIAEEHYVDKLPDNNLVAKRYATDNTSIIELPHYDMEYSWQAEYFDKKGKRITQSPVFHFRVLSNHFNDTNRYRIRVIESKYTDTGFYFFVDNTGGLYNTMGKPIWYSPQIVNNNDRSMGSNLSITPQHTISFILNEAAYETNYFGDVLWRSPNMYSEREANKPHHEYTKRPNGNYLFLSWQPEIRNIPVPDKDGRYGVPGEISFGVINEYDQYGKLVWHWSSSDCFKDDSLIDQINDIKRARGRVHMNAFYFDEQEQAVYVGFKDVSRIVKISYPDKKILGTYYGLGQGDNALFVEQHGISGNSHHELMIFNNNINFSKALPNVLFNHINNDSTISSVVMLRKVAGGDKLERVWEFKCDIDKEAAAGSMRGGNIVELSDGNFFVCTGSPGRIFVVNRKKEVLFNAVIEERVAADQKWEPSIQYRAFPISKTDLDKLVIQSVPAGK